jgi:hypothetical protein
MSLMQELLLFFFCSQPYVKMVFPHDHLCYKYSVKYLKLHTLYDRKHYFEEMFFHHFLYRDKIFPPPPE